MAGRTKGSHEDWGGGKNGSALDSKAVRKSAEGGVRITLRLELQAVPCSERGVMKRTRAQARFLETSLRIFHVPIGPIKGKEAVRGTDLRGRVRGRGRSPIEDAEGGWVGDKSK